MIPSEIIAEVVENTNISLAELWDWNAIDGEARAYDRLNQVKDELWNKIVASTTGKDLSWEEWTQDWTAMQSEYPLPQVVLNENRVKKIQSLSVTYGSATYNLTGDLVYTPARFVDRAGLPNDWDWYVNNQPQSDPIYCVGDKAIFVAPVSPNTVASGLKMTGVKKIPDYDSNTTEDGMVIPDDYHYVLVLGLEAKFIKKQWQRWVAQQAKQEFDQSAQTMLNTQRDTHIWPMFMQFPDDGNYFNRNVWTNTYRTLP